MLRIRKALIAGAFAGMAVAGTLAGTALAVPGANPNDPAYYGPNCTKVEYVDGTTSLVVQPGVTVYIKYGTTIQTYTNITNAPVTLTFPKDISFVITCPPGPTTPPPTTTPPPSPTPTDTPTTPPPSPTPTDTPTTPPPSPTPSYTT